MANPQVVVAVPPEFATSMKKFMETMQKFVDMTAKVQASKTQTH